MMQLVVMHHIVSYDMSWYNMHDTVTNHTASEIKLQCVCVYVSDDVMHDAMTAKETAY